jgi:hypothetical protein
MPVRGPAWGRRCVAVSARQASGEHARGHRGGPPSAARSVQHVPGGPAANAQAGEGHRRPRALVALPGDETSLTNADCASAGGAVSRAASRLRTAAASASAKRPASSAHAASRKPTLDRDLVVRAAACAAARAASAAACGRSCTSPTPRRRRWRQSRTAPAASTTWLTMTPPRSPVAGPGADAGRQEARARAAVHWAAVRR